MCKKDTLTHGCTESNFGQHVHPCSTYSVQRLVSPIFMCCFSKATYPTPSSDRINFSLLHTVAPLFSSPPKGVQGIHHGPTIITSTAKRASRRRIYDRFAPPARTKRLRQAMRTVAVERTESSTSPPSKPHLAPDFEESSSHLTSTPCHICKLPRQFRRHGCGHVSLPYLESSSQVGFKLLWQEGLFPAGSLD